MFPGEAKAGVPERPRPVPGGPGRFPDRVRPGFLDPASAVPGILEESRAGHSGREADRVSSITTDLAGLSGTLALLLIAALVFGETAVFLGFVIPGETAAVLGGVLASRGRVSLPLLIVVVVVAAVTGPLIGYEIGRHLGGRRDRRAADAPGRGRHGPRPGGRCTGAAGWPCCSAASSRSCGP